MLMYKASIITNAILVKEFNYSKGCATGNMSHCLQNDGASFGVLSCYYESQIVKSTCSFPFKFVLLIYVFTC